MGSQEPPLGIRQKLKNTLTHQLCIQFQGIPKLYEIQCESSISQAVQLFSPVQLFATPWTAAHQASLSITNSPELAETHIHRVGNAIQLLSPSSSVVPFSRLQSFPDSGSFSRVSSSYQVAKVFGISASASVLPVNIQDWLPLGLTGWISLQSKGLSRVFSNTTVQKHSFFGTQTKPFFTVQLSHPYITTGKTIALTRCIFVGKVISLLSNTLSRLVIAFLPKSKHLLISWQQSPSAVILEPPKIKSVTVFIVSPSLCHEVMGPDAMIFVFWMLSFKPAFSLSTFTFTKRLFSSSLSAIRVMSSSHLRLLIFLPTILIPACASSSPAFLMMYSAYKLNKQGDSIQHLDVLLSQFGNSLLFHVWF